MSVANASTGNVCGTTMEGWQICVNITGSGLHINSMKGWVHNKTGMRWAGLHIELKGPKGLIKNCPQFALANNLNSPNCIWSPNANEPAGSYCTILWFRLQDGTFVSEGSKCAGVHR
ncbi:MAG TPA: hypothetical protein VFW65_02095 [Pseudonocardiaceae bacterium]|nr:hypothetical protein [Pseudonocardiaceae bacterium]